MFLEEHHIHTATFHQCLCTHYYVVQMYEMRVTNLLQALRRHETKNGKKQMKEIACDVRMCGCMYAYC